MLNRPIRTRLNHEKPSSTVQSTKDQLIDNHDNQYKERMRKYQRNAKEHEFKLGNYFLLKQQKSNKWTTAFEPTFYVVTGIQGSSVHIRCIQDGRELRRDTSKLKLANSLVKASGNNLSPNIEEQDELDDCGMDEEAA